MMPKKSSPLLSFPGMEMQSGPSGPASPGSSYSDDRKPKPKRWYHYLPLCGNYPVLSKLEPKRSDSFSFLVTIFLIFAPHPSLLYVLVDFHLQTLNQPIIFTVHLLSTYTLTFLALSSLIVCVARDPGPVTQNKSVEDAEDDLGEEIDLTEALMPDIDFSAPERWCRKCWVCDWSSMKASIY